MTSLMANLVALHWICETKRFSWVQESVLVSGLLGKGYPTHAHCTAQAHSGTAPQNTH